ncbi:MAG: 6-phosphogluconolactonase, partial [Candidatus Omnitrophica bacterium]|nr:6-phosphogluconolactonase [Candidatus Omnitrophota bacterium]
AYDAWKKSGRRDYFYVAVGGGNTVKRVYDALVKNHGLGINWSEHVRFAAMYEPQSNDSEWESPVDALVENFLRPLYARISAFRGMDLTFEEMVDRMVRRIDPATLTAKTTAKKLNAVTAQQTAELKEILGADISFDVILTGIGKFGQIGMLARDQKNLLTTTPQYQVVRSGTLAGVTLNRGAIRNAGNIILVIAGRAKRMVQLRLIMSDTASLESTILQTPARLLREAAHNTVVFVDKDADQWPQVTYTRTVDGIKVKAEFRAAEMTKAIFIGLIHGFQAYKSFDFQLAGLPMSWDVAALHRGRIPAGISIDRVLAFHAQTARDMVVKHYRAGQPVALAHHSDGGAITEYLAQLIPSDKELQAALRTGGLIRITPWTRSDVLLAAGIPYNPALVSQLATIDNWTRELTVGSFNMFNANPFVQMTLGMLHAAGLRGYAMPLDLQSLIPGAEQSWMQKYLTEERKNVPDSRMIQEAQAILTLPFEYAQQALDIYAEYGIPVLTIAAVNDGFVSYDRLVAEHEALVAKRAASKFADAATVLETLTDNETRNSAVQGGHVAMMEYPRRVNETITQFVENNVEKAKAFGWIKNIIVAAIVTAAATFGAPEAEAQTQETISDMQYQADLGDSDSSLTGTKVAIGESPARHAGDASVPGRAETGV